MRVFHPMMQAPAPAPAAYNPFANLKVPSPFSGAWPPALETLFPTNVMSGTSTPVQPPPNFGFVSARSAPDTNPLLPSAWQGQFEIVREMPVIGSGSFGTIFHVRDRGNQRTFAVKVIQRRHYERRGMGKQLSTEINAMQRANKACTDPGWSRVVQLHGYVEENGCIFLMLELCVHGNLAQQLHNSPAGIKEGSAARCARHLFQGLRDIHAARIIHRDIKPENLLLTTNGVLKIADFGWAANVSERATGFAGTFETMAPEVLKGHKHTTAVDIWSAGVVLYQMVTGKRLLAKAKLGVGATQLSHTDPEAAANKRCEAALSEIEAKCPLSRKSKPKHVNKSCWDLICSLLEPEPHLRPTAEEVLDHPWLTENRPRYGGA